MSKESDVLLFLEFINIVSILFYNFIEFIILLYTFLVISFARYKEYMICLISFSKFSDVLPAFTCASAIGNLWKIRLGIHILSCFWFKNIRSETLAMQSKMLVSSFPCFILGYIPLSKASRTFCFPLRSTIAFLIVSASFLFSLILLVL